MTKTHYNRKYLRRHFDTNIYVSNDGKHAERDITLKTGEDSVMAYDIYHDECGRAWIHDKYKGNLFLDRLVLTCFRGREPQDGKVYYPHHKDGNMKNSHISNLEWREETPSIIEAYRKLEIEAWYKNRKIRVLKDGSITQKGSKLHFIDVIPDSDMGWIYHRPYHWVRYEDVKNIWGRNETKTRHVNEIFEELGLINGDKTKFSHPVILHLNNDYEDYNTGNLEWCDSSDPRYIEFDRVRHDAVMEKDRKSNHPVNERDWNTIYNGEEAYQDWNKA